MQAAGTKVFEFEERPFSVSVQGENWMITVGSAVATNIGGGTVGSANATDIIHMRYGKTDPVIVIVESNSFPTGFNLPVVPHLWIMFASGTFFEQWKGGPIPAMHKYAYIHYDKPRGRPVFAEQNVTAVFNESLPKLPSFIRFYNNGWSDPMGTNGPRRLRRPFENGYVNATYEATDWLTAGDLKLPGSCVFRQFFPDFNGGSSNATYVGMICEAKVALVKDKCSQQPLQIDLPNSFYAALDHRLENASNAVVAVEYTSGNFKRLPSPQELQDFWIRRHPPKETGQ